LIVLTGSLILNLSNLLVMQGCMMMASRNVVVVRLCSNLHYSRMAINACRLHHNRSSQRVAAEKRQPDGQKYRNKLSERS